jgi:Caspase domain
MSRAALCIGIDDYSESPLTGCVADAERLSGILERHADNSLDFQCRVLVSSEAAINKTDIVQGINDVFSNKDADVAVFYFAGHGVLTNSGGFLAAQDRKDHDEGVPMAQLVAAANSSPSREKIIILDCCHSGAIDQLFKSGANVPLTEGVSILAACRTEQEADEIDGRGLFTSLICDALNGGAADIRGYVNVASLYSYVNEILTIWEQRPLFKANVTKLIPIRRANASVSDEKLRTLTTYFPNADYKFPLDPSYEPQAEPKNPAHEAVFGDLQRYRGARLLVPDGEEHMYFAAMNSKSCSLTPLGKFYWQCVKAGTI